MKEVKDNIQDFENVSTAYFVSLVTKDFFEKYRNVKIYNGAQAKIAIYFPSTDYVNEAKKIVEKTLLELGIDPNAVLAVNNKSEESVKDFFNNRINDVSNPYRVYLLVNMGTEGWNCPSLFATALARKLTSIVAIKSSCKTIRLFC